MTAGIRTVEALAHRAITHPGRVREANEDRYLVEAWPDGDALLVVIADGMGGQAGGAVAAQIVVDSFREILGEVLSESWRERYEQLLGCFYKAVGKIKERAAADWNLQKMAATAVAAVVTPSECLILYAGDCRFYHFRGDSTLFATSDHSVTRILVEAGEITAEEVPNHLMRSLVTSSLSASQVSVLNVDPKWNEAAQEQPAIRKLLPGDILLFCTDGLTGEVDPAFYLALFGRTGESPDSIAWACLGAALGAGGRDNVTVAAITVK